MIKIKAKISTAQVKRLQNVVQKTPSRVRNELNKAINATTKKTQTYIAKEIISTEGLNVTGAAVKRTQDKKRSTVRSLGAVIIIRKKDRIPLKDFKARQTKTGVAYKIRKKGATKVIQGGFKVKAYGNNVYKRPTSRRPTGSRKKGPSVWGFFLGQKMKPRVKQFIQKQLNKEINERLRVLKLKQAGKI